MVIAKALIYYKKTVLVTLKISCSNKMGAAGTLRWEKNGSVTGSGFDYNENKVKFTLSKKI